MEKKYYTITTLNEYLNTTLEKSIGQVVFSGEIHQLTRPQSGHIYFELKDPESKISAVIWRGVAASLPFKPDAGMEVLCTGRPNVYHRSGRLQMIVFKIEPAGEGALQKKFIALKAALEKEGLFREDRKRRLPFFPRAIGLVTSGSGAAIHDMLVKLNERMPVVKKYLLDVRVQGEGAAQEIAAAIEYFNILNTVDVIVVGRGGGSLEDLWAFNEEVVVRAIFASQIPVVSAVGHEVDIALSDLVADVRAPTPTAAAELLVPSREDLQKRLVELYRRLSDTDRWLQPLHQALDEAVLSLSFGFQRMIQTSALQLESIQSRVKSIEPNNRLQLLSRQILENDRRLARAALLTLSNKRAALESLEERLELKRVANQLERYREALSIVETRLTLSMRGVIGNSKQRIAAHARLLDSVNPRRVLERGFAIVHNRDSLVRSVDQIAVNDTVSVTLGTGGFEASVTTRTDKE